MEGNGNQTVFRSLVGLPHLFQPLVVFRLILPDAKHILPDPAGVIAIRKTLPVKSGSQRLHHIPGHIAGLDGLPVGAGDRSHILRALHAAFQFHGSHAHLLQILQIVDQTVILQTQRMQVLPAAIAVALTAGLGTATPVAGTAADGCGQIALTGIAHAQGAVGKHFDLNRGIFADIADLLPAQLPAQHHTAETPGCAKLHTGQVVDRHLGRAV